MENVAQYSQRLTLVTRGKGDDAARAELIELTRAHQASRNAAFAVVALIIAVCSEGLALCGVAAPRAGWVSTVAVAAGLVTGGAVLLVPLAVGSLHLWRSTR